MMAVVEYNNFMKVYLQHASHNGRLCTTSMKTIYVTWIFSVLTLISSQTFQDYYVHVL